MKSKALWTILAAGSLVFSVSTASLASGRGGGNCKNCPMSAISREERAGIKQQLKALKDSGADGEEIRALKDRIAGEYGVQMPEGRKNRGRNRKK